MDRAPTVSKYYPDYLLRGDDFINYLTHFHKRVKLWHNH